ncbi:hypothetical protein GCM10009854_10490 [Saccharopolyspora halophila]|uniref:Uncharacterized protein n=1 Tax=Saccharopolyspora halophila TaxID=405551 RepID=A0ABN3FSD8_9PSEU
MTSASCAARTRSGRFCMIGADDDSGLCHIHDPDRRCGVVLAGGAACAMQAGASGFCWKHEPSPRPRASSTPSPHGVYGPPPGYSDYAQSGQAPAEPDEPLGDALSAAKAVRTATQSLVLGDRAVGAEPSTGAAILREVAEAVRDLGTLGWKTTADDEIRHVTNKLASRMEAHAAHASYALHS